MTTPPTTPNVPSVGIFWGIAVKRDQVFILAELAPVQAAEPYGEFMTYGGHDKYWTQLVTGGAHELRRLGLPTAPIWSEYDEWPRGRVVYHVPTQRFSVYADWQLQAPVVMAQIIERFGLSEAGHDIRSDQHYVSVRRIAKD